MKSAKTNLLFLVIGTLTFVLGLYFYSTMSDLGVFEIVMAGLVLIGVVFGIVIGIKRVGEEKKGIPADDEMSFRIKQKAAAKAFGMSFYLWTFIVIFTVDSNIEVVVPFAIGLLGMAVLFIAFWIHYSNKGIQIGDEN